MIYDSDNMKFSYYIGEQYAYPSGATFTLVAVDRFKFLFEPKHWCTDTVFMGLIRVKTGQRVCDGYQLHLF